MCAFGILLLFAEKRASMVFFLSRVAVLSAVCGAGFSFAMNASTTQAYAPTPRLVTANGSAPSDLSPQAWGLGYDWNWDPSCKQEGGPGNHNGKTIRQIIFMRHGQYLHEKTRSDGLEPNQLTKLGEVQSYATGVFLGNEILAAIETEKRVVELSAAKGRLASFKKRFGLGGRNVEDGSSSSAEIQKQWEDLQTAEHRAEALHTARGGFLISPHVRTMYVSNMIRAQQTASILREGMESVLKPAGEAHRMPVLLTDETLKERFPIPPVPYTSKVPKTVSPDVVEQAEEVFHRYFYRPQRGSWPQPLDAMRKLWSASPWFTSGKGKKFPDHFQNAETSVDIVIGHSNMMRYMLLRALQLPPEAWLRLTMPHCSITSLKMYQNGLVTMMCHGSCSHLPPGMITTRNAYYSADI